MLSMKKVIGIGLATALTLGAVNSSSAAPVSGAAALKQAVPGTVADVRWRGGWRGGWFPGAVALGVLGGAAAIATYPFYGYPRYAYYPGPYYGGPYWGPRPYWGWRHRYWRRHHWRR